MMQHSYDKSNNVFYYRDRGRKVATSATVEGLDKKLIDLGYKVKPRKETSQVTVQDAFTLFLQEKQPPVVREKTYRDYKNFINIYNEDNNLRIDNKLILHKRLFEIDRSYMLSVLKLLKHRYSNKSEVSINHWFGILKNALGFTYEYYSFNTNPMIDKELRFNFEKKKGWSPSRKDALIVLDAVDKYCLPSHALFTHLCAHGLRASEANGLKVHDFDFERKRFEIVRTVDANGCVNKTKSSSSARFVKMDSHLMKKMLKFTEGMKATDWLFTGAGGKPKGQKTLRENGLKKALRILRKKNPNFIWRGGMHPLRHYYASIVLQVGIKKGKSPIWMSKQLGHSSFTTTVNMYGHIIDDDDDAMAEELSPTKR